MQAVVRSSLVAAFAVGVVLSLSGCRDYPDSGAIDGGIINEEENVHTARGYVYGIKPGGIEALRAHARDESAFHNIEFAFMQATLEGWEHILDRSYGGIEYDLDTDAIKAAVKERQDEHASQMDAWLEDGIAGIEAEHKYWEGELIKVKATRRNPNREDQVRLVGKEIERLKRELEAVRTNDKTKTYFQHLNFDLPDNLEESARLYSKAVGKDVLAKYVVKGPEITYDREKAVFSGLDEGFEAIFVAAEFLYGSEYDLRSQTSFHIVELSEFDKADEIQLEVTYKSRSDFASSDVSDNAIVIQKFGYFDGQADF